MSRKTPDWWLWSVSVVAGTGIAVTSRCVVEFLNTVCVSCFGLGGGQFGENHRLVDDLDGGCS